MESILVPLPRSGSRLMRICLGPWDSLYHSTMPTRRSFTDAELWTILTAPGLAHSRAVRGLPFAT
jgi:hypothetical protein